MKVAVNKCYGGFSLSKLATARLAELNGRKAYFFTYDYGSGKLNLGKYTRCGIEEDGRFSFWHAFDIPNPNEVFARDTTDWHSLSDEEKKNYNSAYERHSIDHRQDDRSDPKLIQVIEELGEKANGLCASIKIVEIPDGVDYEIQEYDGQEWIAEKHRTW